MRSSGSRLSTMRSGSSLGQQVPGDQRGKRGIRRPAPTVEPRHSDRRHKMGGGATMDSDDGALSQSALRVMQGQLPHRDFAEIYTGGLSFIHALAFRIFGVNLISLRICVFLFFLAW